MMRSAFVWVLAFLLCAVAGALFYYKAFTLSFPLSPDATSDSWRVEVRMIINGRGKPVSAALHLPRFSQGFAVVDENFISDGYGFETTTDKENYNRQAVWTKRNVRGRDNIFYRAVIYQVDNSANAPVAKPDLPKDVFGSRRFRDMVDGGDPFYLSLNNIITPLREASSSDRSFARQLINWIETNSKNDDLQVIRRENDNDLNARQAAILILRYAGIGARLMHGVYLSGDQRGADLTARVEMYDGKGWRPLDNDSDQPFMPWWSGDDDFFVVDGARVERTTLSMRRHQEKALTEAIWRGDAASEQWYHLSIYDLPLDVQLLFTTLLMIPLGGLVVALCRQIIGINTFGTFMPILIAISFRETQLAWGIVFFTVIVAMGLGIRMLISRLHLLMVPRLTAVLTCVVLILFILSLSGFRTGLHAGLSISLFPIIIITMLIERMTTTIEESGYRAALINALGSLFVAVLSYPVMTHPVMVHFVTTFPELLLVVLALCILMGRYNGYKLTEYWRFRHIRNDV
jgi:hypothetical protein